MVYHDISQEQLLLLITQAVQAELQKRSRQVPVGISVRHIHLTRDDVDKLFGYGYQLIPPKKALSQPGQFACEECLDIIGPKGELKHVRILGPERSATQIELAQTDCRNIGIKAPVRSSGDTKGTPGVTLRGPRGGLHLLARGVRSAEPDVLVQGVVEHEGFLEHEGHQIHEVVGAQFGQGMPVDAHRALARFPELGMSWAAVVLPAPEGAHERGQAAGGQIEADVGERVGLGGAVAERDVIERHRVRFRRIERERAFGSPRAGP